MPKLKGIFARRRKLVHKKGAERKAVEARRLRQEEAALEDRYGDSLEDSLSKATEILKSFAKNADETSVRSASPHIPEQVPVPRTTPLISALKKGINRVKDENRSKSSAPKKPDVVPTDQHEKPNGEADAWSPGKQRAVKYL